MFLSSIGVEAAASKLMKSSESSEEIQSAFNHDKSILAHDKKNVSQA